MARWNNVSVWGGLALIVLGLLFFAGQIFSFNIMRLLWPLFIVGAGSVFLIGMLSGGRGTAALAVPGCVIVTVGLILLVQNAFGLWATWTYAWALIIVGAGLGLILFGRRGDIPEVAMAGRIAATVGMVLFFLFGLFFELGASLLGMRSPGGILWPLLLILLGLYVLVGRPMFGRMAGPVSRSAVSFHTARHDDPAGAVIDGMVRENADTSGVRRVRFQAIGDLTITQGEQEGLEIEASQSVKDRLRAEVRGDTLEIRFEQDWWAWMMPGNWNTGPIRFALTVRDLEYLLAAGVGSTVVPALNTRRFELSSSGAGSVAVHQLTAQELVVSLSGVGEVRVEGQATRQEVHLSGAGSYHAERLQSSQARVRLSGLGSARLTVLEDLDAQISGTGSIEYAGSPRVSQRVSGLGSVQQVRA